MFAGLPVAWFLFAASGASAQTISCPLKPGEQVTGISMTVGPPEGIRPPATTPNNSFAPEGRLYRLPPVPSGYFVLCSYSSVINGRPRTMTRNFGPVRARECRVSFTPGTLECNGATVATLTPTGGCLAYEPSVVSLTGTVRRVPAFGPPNYGESPKTDSREDYAALHLDTPICTRAPPGNVMNGSQDGLRDLQLVFTDGAPAALVGAKVTVTGTLFSAQTGHHHTKVLLTVASVAR